jgi:glycosyltransferase involved in cell wall biosynthesis
VKSLVVGQDFPWPPAYGSHLRLAQVVRALGELGDVDLFTLTFPLRTDPCDVPSDVALRRVCTATGPRPDFSARRRLRWWTLGRGPLEHVAAHPTTAAPEFAAWVDPPYDFVWFSKATTYELMGRPRLGPTAVDFDDLEDQKIRARLAAMRLQGRPRGARALVHERMARIQANTNRRRWHRFQMSVASSVERVVLCSDLDVARLGSPNAVVVPNGYDPPARAAGRLEVGQPPTLLLQGSLRYGPNTDAARWLVNDILPAIQAERPDVRVRLVGEADAGVTKLHAPPAVTVVGRVASMETELARADVVAVPIRYGSGTRVKILEAFAHRLPVVSTTIGAEGLGVTDGHHLLVADDARGFARACLVLIDRPDLRGRLTEAAHTLFMECFQWSRARDRVQDLARAMSEVASP